MRRYLRLLAVAILGGSSLALSGAGPAGIPAAHAAVCAAGQNQAFVTLKSTITWYHYRETYSGGGQPSISGKITILSGGGGKITYTFCVGGSSSAGWSIKRAPDVVEYAYNGIDSNLNVTNGTGFALRATYVNAKSLVVEPTICRHDGRLDFLKWIVGLPIPGLDYAMSVGVYLVGAAIPSGGNTCQAFANETVPVSFQSSNGNTTAANFSDNFYHKVQIKTGSCVTPPNSCWDVDEYRWVVTAQ